MNFIFASTILGTISAPIIKNIPQMPANSQRIHHYFFRLPLFSEKHKTNTAFIDEDKFRLEGYYKKYYSHPTHLNLITKYGTENMEGSNNPNIYVQVKRMNVLESEEWEWLKTIKLNQLTIDRLFEKKSQDTDLIPGQLYKEIIKVENLFPEHSKVVRNALNQDAIDIYLKNVKISNEEIKRLVYFPSNQIGTKRWYVWWDKQILQVKLNLGFQIWFFNQPFLKSTSFVKDFFNSKPNLKSRISMRKKIKNLYQQMSQAEKDLFELYFKEIWVKKSKNKEGNFALEAMEINSEEINHLYNFLKEKEKSLEIFKGHLVQVLNGGDKSTFESFFPSFVTYASGPDAMFEIEETDKYNKDIKLTITPDRFLNRDWNIQELCDILQNYSAKYFTLRTKNGQKTQWPSIIFDNSSSNIFPIIRESHFSENHQV